ncbi:MAG: diguanylate cyclase [Nitrospirae bacterium GWC2_42_7]|nr:MAG: diguanylate cyclase [Nitrospirae bacterium GWC2_42_7]
MKICFPVKSDNGINSEVYNHFGSAPSFVIIDTETDSTTVINNNDQHHAHGGCSPLKALDGHSVDAVIVGGIGAGALNKLNHAGIKVYQPQASSIAENIKMFKSQALSEFMVQHTCSGHGNKGGCAH